MWLCVLTSGVGLGAVLKERPGQHVSGRCTRFGGCGWDAVE